MLLPKAIQIGPLTFHSYGFIFAMSILLGYLLAKKRAHLYKIPRSLFDDPILLIPLALGIAGARLYHVIDYWHVYRQDLPSIFNFSGGGLGIWGGLIGTFLGFWIVAKKRKLQILPILDLISPSLLLGQAIGRLGNWVNQEAFGPPADLPWGIYINPENRPGQFASSTHFHPTFFYEAAIDLIFFIVLLSLSKKFKKPGQTFALYLILYSTGRFIVEFFRIDTATVGTVKVAQVLALAGIATGLAILKLKKTWG
ncbi:prolipoprotein diacylglyceryl transferase [Candidatus Curtissbacteria bacterium]|nr:prolipoprotein diacylglyceryl transferase [Candidatus Curtissbacteria bacterium]